MSAFEQTFGKTPTLLELSTAIFPRSYPEKLWRALLLYIASAGIGAGVLTAYFVFGAYPAEALLVAGCVAPTATAFWLFKYSKQVHRVDIPAHVHVPTHSRIYSREISPLFANHGGNDTRSRISDSLFKEVLSLGGKAPSSVSADPVDVAEHILVLAKKISEETGPNFDFKIRRLSILDRCDELVVSLERARDTSSYLAAWNGFYGVEVRHSMNSVLGHLELELKNMLALRNKLQLRFDQKMIADYLAFGLDLEKRLKTAAELQAEMDGLVRKATTNVD